MNDHIRKSEEAFENSQAIQVNSVRPGDLSGKYEELKREYERIQQQYIRAEEEKILLRERLEDVNKESADLLEKYEQVIREKTQLVEQHALLEKDFQDLCIRLKACEDRFNTNYELFKSFVDNDAEKILLIDMTYALKYINHAASELLQLPDNGGVLGRRIFDFMEYRDALRLKAKIDNAFLKGNKEKIRDIRFQARNGIPTKLKMKIVRVRYEDRPSVKLIVR